MVLMGSFILSLHTQHVVIDSIRYFRVSWVSWGFLLLTFDFFQRRKKLEKKEGDSKKKKEKKGKNEK